MVKSQWEPSTQKAETRPSTVDPASHEPQLTLVASLAGAPGLSRDFQQRLLDTLPAAIYATDAEGTVTYFNKAAAELAGREPVIGRDKWCVTWKLFTLDGKPLPHDECPMALTLKEKRAVRGVEAVAERPDGVRVPFMPFPTPIFDAAGTLVGALNMLVDISERKQLELDGLAERQRIEGALKRRAAEREALYVLADRLGRAQSIDAIYAATFDAMFVAMRCDRASILLCDDTGAMKFAAWRGLSDGYRRAVEGHSPWTPDVKNPVPIAVPDIATSSEPEALKSIVIDEGIRGLLFVPLMVDGELIGKFMTYYNRPHDFTDEELDLALTIARQLGFNIARARAEKARQAAEADLKRERERLQESEARERARVAELSTIMESVPAVIWIARDPESDIIVGNERSYEVLRLPQNANASLTAPVDERPTHFDVYSGGRKLESHELPVQRAARGEDLQNVELEIRFKDSEPCFLLGSATPLWDEKGHSRGAVAAFVDVTDRQQEAIIRERLAAIVESSDDAIISKDLKGTIVSWNKAAERLFGYTAAEAIGKPILILIPEDRQTEEPQILGRIHAGERVDHFETVRRRKDGSLMDISLTISPIKDGSGRIVGASKIARDIGEKKRSEAQRNLLIAELSHRVKNTLATVISIARQSFAHTDVEQARRSFDARIRGLARTHSRLAEANWSGVSLGTIVHDECAPYRRDDGKNVSIAGSRQRLNPKCALTLGMALHELATNAAKYGALSAKDGAVNVTWNEQADGTLVIQWTEAGGPPVRAPERSGFGRLLLERALASDLHGKVQLDFAENGLRCLIAIPASEHRPATS
jgi:PAS domain S-box-containing protein